MTLENHFLVPYQALEETERMAMGHQAIVLLGAPRELGLAGPTK